MFERIVVGLDGSPSAEQALPAAEELARRLDAPMHLIQVADVTWLRFGSNEAALAYASLGEAFATEEADAKSYLDTVRTLLAERALTATIEVRRGFAARELVAVAQPADLLVLATHGRSGPARLLLGSVAEEVVRRSSAPVLLVRVGAADAASGSG